MLRSRVRAALLCVVLLSLVAACGGEGSRPVTLPSRTASGLPSRTATVLPTNPPTNALTSAPTSPPPSRPTNPPSTRPTSRPTNPPSTTPTTNPATEPTRTQSAAPTSAPASASASPGPAAADQGQRDADDTAWWWLLAAALVVVGAIVAALLVRRSRRRRAWGEGLAEAEHEVGWFARDLVPQLRGSGSLAGVAGGWSVAAPRVAALDDRLSGLVTTAPGDDERARATAVQAAVRTARDRVAALVSGGGSDTWSLDLDGAQAPLLSVLVPPSSAGEPTPGP
jgi:hypothetical protein